MTSKNLFFKLMREDIKRRLWAMTLVLLAWFFVFPVRIAMIPGDYRFDNEVQRKMMIAQRAEEWFRINNGYVITCIIIGAVVLGLSSFSYLHSRRKVDFYHSIPVRRETLFFVNFVDGFVLMLVPYLLFMVVGAVIAAGIGASPVVLSVNIAKSLCFHMIYFLLMYATVVVAMMMTGNLFLGILGVLVFFSYVPLLGVLVELLFDSSFVTYANSAVFLRKMVNVSPFSAYIQAVDLVGEAEQNAFMAKLPIGQMASALAVAAVLMGVALWLYQKRPSEAAGKAMAFPLSRTPIKVLLVIPLSLYSMMFFWGIRQTMPWALFGIVFGSVFFHCLIEILYHFDFRKLFAHPVHLALCFAASLVIFLGFHFDMFGYDAYLPKADQIESAYLDTRYFENWIDYGKYERQDGTIQWVDEHAENYVREHMMLEDKDSVLAMASAGVSYLDEFKKNGRSTPQRYEDEAMINYTIGYRMKSGKIKIRRYFVPRYMVDTACETILNSMDYKEGRYPVMQQSADEVYQMYVRFHEGARAGLQELEPSQIEAVLAAYQKDMEALTVSTQKEESVMGMLLYVVVKDMGDRDEFDSLLEKKIGKQEISANWRGNYYQQQYPIYPSFENTLEVLRGFGVDLEEDTYNDYVQCKIEIMTYYAEGHKFLETAVNGMVREGVQCSIDEDGEKVTYVYTNPDEVAQIYPALTPSQYANLNVWSSYEDYIEVTLQKASGSSLTRTHYLNLNQAPDFLLEDIGYFSHLYE